MAEEGGGNPEPRSMVSAQPPALSPDSPVPDDLLGSGKLDFRETVDQRRLAELHNLLAEPRSEMYSTRYSLRGRCRRWSSNRELCPEYRLSTNERRSFTHENALTELAVRSSLSGRFV